MRLHKKKAWPPQWKEITLQAVSLITFLTQGYLASLSFLVYLLIYKWIASTPIQAWIVETAAFAVKPVLFRSSRPAWVSVTEEAGVVDAVVDAEAHGEASGVVAAVAEALGAGAVAGMVAGEVAVAEAGAVEVCRSVEE